MIEKAKGQVSLSYAHVDEILRIIEEFPAAEIRFEYQDLKLYVRRTTLDSQQVPEPVQRTQTEQLEVPQQARTDQPQKAPSGVTSDKKSKPQEPTPGERKGLLPVTAPMMGVFYCAPAPGAEPFVKVGQKVSTGTDLCIIEVMKVMNLIKAPSAGVIVEINAENGNMVEFEQVLMWIKP